MLNRETQKLSSCSSSKTGKEKGGNVDYWNFRVKKKCFHYKNSHFLKFLFYVSFCSSCIREMPLPEGERWLCKDEFTENKIHCNLHIWL